MDPRNARVYGNRRTRSRHEVLAAQRFAAFSSPVAASKSSCGLEKSSMTASEGLIMPGDEEDIGFTRTMAEFEALDLSGMKDVVVGKPQRKEDELQRRVLTARDVNTPVNLGRRAVRKTRKEHQDSAPSRALPTATSKKKLTKQHNAIEVEVVRQAPSHTGLDEHCQLDQSTESAKLPVKTRCAALPSRSSSDLATYTKPLLDLCSDPAGMVQPTPFQIWADSLAEFFIITKIAEASYGEVYRLSLKDTNARFSKADESVLKVIALKPPASGSGSRKCRNGKLWQEKLAAMSEVKDVAGEVRLLQRMSPVPGFTNFRECRVMVGRLPAPFAAAWQEFNKNVKTSLFADPCRKSSYADDQLWAVIEMQDAGTDLESVSIDSVYMCWDAFWSVAIALAKGEEMARFEHRDLHLGNICIRTKSPKSSSEIVLGDERRESVRKLGFTGSETTIIDYTISRADMAKSCCTDMKKEINSKQLVEVSPMAVDEEAVAYFDLSRDPTIFEGDGNEDDQYNIYRYMRAAVLHGDPTAQLGTMTSFPTDVSVNREKQKGRCSHEREQSKELKNEDSWRGYHPMTNTIWLSFVLRKLMSLMARTSGSAMLYNAAWPTPAALEKRLVLLQQKLKLESMKSSSLRSAADLVKWAVQQDWLNEADVMGSTA